MIRTLTVTLDDKRQTFSIATNGAFTSKDIVKIAKALSNAKQAVALKSQKKAKIDVDKGAAL